MTSMLPTVTLCVVTCSRELILRFIEHHRDIFLPDSVEVLVFSNQEDVAVVNAAIARTGWTGRCQGDGVRSGPSRKRNVLLREARGRSVMFLDDDSLFVGGRQEWAQLMQFADGRQWVLFDVIFTYEGGMTRRPMRVFRPGTAGSGIEWNQLWPTALLKQIGGWPEDFCTGERWKSGGALAVAINCWHAGLRQVPCAGVAFSHPRQVYGNNRESINKGRRYRYAIGAVLAAFGGKLMVSDRLVWAVRLGILAPAGSLPAFLSGQWATGLVRLMTPIDILNGAWDYQRARNRRSLSRAGSPAKKA